MIYSAAPLPVEYLPQETAPIDTPITVTFNTDLNLLSLDNCVVLLDSEGNRVAGEITYANRTITFRPLSLLSPETLYRVKILGSEVRSVLGLPMKSDFDFAFRTDSGAGLPAPLPIYPNDYSIVPPPTTRLTWSPVTGADKYKVILSQSPSMDPVLWPQDDALVEGTEVIPDINLDGQVYWRVMAVTSEGIMGAWSEIRTFTVDEPPVETVNRPEVEVLAVYPPNGRSNIPLTTQHIRLVVLGNITQDDIQVEMVGTDVFERDDEVSHGKITPEVQLIDNPDSTQTILITLPPLEVE